MPEGLDKLPCVAVGGLGNMSVVKGLSKVLARI